MSNDLNWQIAISGNPHWTTASFPHNAVSEQNRKETRMQEEAARVASRGVDLASVRNARRQRSVDLRRRARGAVAQAKRRRDAGAPGSYSGAEVDAALRALAMCAAGGGVLEDSARQACRDLRSWLALPSSMSVEEDGVAIMSLSAEGERFCSNKVAMELCTSKKLSGVLGNLLASESPSSEDEDFVMNALWCLTDLSSGSAEQSLAAMAAAPQAVRLLLSRNLDIRGQAAWALGNMASESQDIRERLRQMGVITPLVVILRENPSPEGLQAKTKAAWALCSLTRGRETSGKPFFDAAAHLAMISLLQTYGPNAVEESRTKIKTETSDLIAEVLWTLSFLSAKEPNLCLILVHNGVLGSLNDIFVNGIFNIDIALPALRSIGNLMPLQPDGSEIETLVPTVCELPGFLDTLAALLIHPSVNFVKEALWIVSNLCAYGGSATCFERVPKGKGRQFTLEDSKLFNRILDTFLNPILRHLTESPRDLQREAAFAIFNLSSRENPLTLAHIMRAPTNPPVTEIFIEFLGARDVELVRVALDMIELTLCKLDNPFGATLLKGQPASRFLLQFDVITGLENLQFNSAIPELNERAGAIVDSFYGESFDEDDDEEMASEIQHPLIPNDPSQKTLQDFGFNFKMHS